MHSYQLHQRCKWVAASRQCMQADNAIAFNTSSNHLSLLKVVCNHRESSNHRWNITTWYSARQVVVYNSYNNIIPPFCLSCRRKWQLFLLQSLRAERMGALSHAQNSSKEPFVIHGGTKNMSIHKNRLVANFMDAIYKQVILNFIRQPWKFKIDRVCEINVFGDISFELLLHS